MKDQNKTGPERTQDMKARFLAIALFALASTGLSAKDLVVVVGGSGQSGIEVVKLLTEVGPIRREGHRPRCGERPRAPW